MEFTKKQRQIISFLQHGAQLHVVDNREGTITYSGGNSETLNIRVARALLDKKVVEKKDSTGTYVFELKLSEFGKQFKSRLHGKNEKNLRRNRIKNSFYPGS